MKYIGAHVSIAGGVFNAPLQAAEIGASAFAMFTKNQRQWSAKPLTDEEIALFKHNCADKGFVPEAILPHDSYLINLGNPDDGKRRAAQDAFIDEMRRAESLGLVYLNFHPGSGLGVADDETTLRNIAEGVRRAIGETERMRAVIENTAGQGNVVGHSFEQLARLLELIDAPDRTGVCIDTCHAFAAGYDWNGLGGYDFIFDEFERLVGFDHLYGMHLNDSMGKISSHLDRHASLGDGELGKELFIRLAQDPRLDGIPLILETPDAEKWPAEITLLRSAAAAK